MRLSCPKCNAAFDSDAAAGASVQCPVCQHAFTAGADAQSPAAPARDLPRAKGGTVQTLGVLGMLASLLGFTLCPLFPLAGMMFSLIGLRLGTVERGKIARGQVAPVAGIRSGVVFSAIGMVAGIASITFTIVIVGEMLTTSGGPISLGWLDDADGDDGSGSGDDAEDAPYIEVVESFTMPEYETLHREAHESMWTLEQALVEAHQAEAILEDDEATEYERKHALVDARSARRRVFNAALDTYTAGYKALAEYEMARATMVIEDFRAEHGDMADTVRALEALLKDLDSTELPESAREAIATDPAIQEAREDWLFFRNHANDRYAELENGANE